MRKPIQKLFIKKTPYRDVWCLVCVFMDGTFNILDRSLHYLQIKKTYNDYLTESIINYMHEWDSDGEHFQMFYGNWNPLK